MLVSSSKRALSSRDHRDLLASPHSFEQQVHQRRLRAGAVNRLPDGDDVRVFDGTTDELHHRRERLVGMMQQHIALAQLGEHPLVG